MEISFLVPVVLPVVSATLDTMTLISTVYSLSPGIVRLLALAVNRWSIVSTRMR
jgi:hypothetical protein